jgi:hypothetical protein
LVNGLVDISPQYDASASRPLDEAQRPTTAVSPVLTVEERRVLDDYRTLRRIVFQVGGVTHFVTADS